MTTQVKSPEMPSGLTPDDCRQARIYMAGVQDVIAHRMGPEDRRHFETIYKVLRVFSNEN